MEATHLANFIADEMKTYDLKPRDFAPIVRMKAGEEWRARSDSNS
jgi:hypothetical protein